jgi:CDP-diacylglycerol---serine O-phosphatidyltransferase
MKKHLPNFLTCCNLLCGCFGIIFILEGRDIPAAYFVWAACVFDFFDGFTARMLKVSSPIGKELDSLADMVSFGILPSMVMYKLLQASPTAEYIPYIALTIAVFSGLRLAIFNVDETQRDSFKGLPTPANTIFISALPLAIVNGVDWLQNPVVLIVITIVFSLLLVSRVDLFALKFKNFTWDDNRLRFSFLGIAVVLLIVFKTLALPLIIILYVLLSLINNTIGNPAKRESH